jgi:hypothetical protein
MNILIPMAGEGLRFVNQGYKIHKPIIPTTNHRTGQKNPMVVCATLDLPEINNPNTKIIYIDRDFHRQNGIENEIKNFFPNANFITTNQLTQGQASSCLLAIDLINNSEELLISGCDNGIIYDQIKFNQTKQDCDVIVFTFTKNQVVTQNPNAYGWAEIDEFNQVKSVSVKKPISENPIEDHAIVSTFWFKTGMSFVKNAQEMIDQNDRINNEFYVDQVIKYCLINKLKVKAFSVDKYLCFGTPKDYEEYEKTINYWHNFYKKEMQKKLSIIIPCYNEEKNIPLIIKKFNEAIKQRTDIEVILVNNGSTDNSKEILKQYLTELTDKNPFKIIDVEINQGYGYGILQGLKNVNGDFIGWTHADLQTDPNDVIRALELIEKNNNDQNLYIKGSRTGRKLFDYFFTIGMSIFESILMQTKLWEINAQPNIFHKSFFAKWQNPPHDFALDLYAYYQAKIAGLKILRISVKFPKRIHGISSWNNSFFDKWKFIKRTINFSLKLKKELKK